VVFYNEYMKKWVILAMGLMIAVVAADIFVVTRPHTPAATQSESQANQTRNRSMKLTSSAFTYAKR
jgi:hypothetical protein